MAVLASDNFNRADENPLSGGGNWKAGTSPEIAFQLKTNVATPSATTNDNIAYFDGGITWPNDQFSRADLSSPDATGGDQGIGLVVRQSAVGTGITHYRAITSQAASSNTALSKEVAGVYTNFALTQITWTNGDRWELDAQGTTITFLHSGVSALSTTDAALTSGFPGLIASTSFTTPTIDNWEGGDFTVPSSGAYVPVRIANKRVGPAVLRYHYRQPHIPQASSSANVFQQALTATAVAVTASILKTVNIIRAATSIVVTGSILKQVNATLTATAVAVTASILKQVNKILTATPVVVTGTLSALKAVLLSMTATAVVVTASMTKSVLKNLTATSVAATGSMVKSVGKILSAASTVTATMTKQVGKILTATSVAATASLSAIKAILVTMTATAVTVTASLTATFQAGAAFLFKYIPLFRPRRR